MGKKKRPAGPAQIPLFYAKKRKLNEATQLTALVALHKYCAKFKLGQVGYRQKRAEPYVITCVMDGQELGTAQHADKDTAMEKASLLTLHVRDPEGKSVRANLNHPDENELKRLAQLYKDEVGKHKRALGDAKTQIQQRSDIIQRLKTSLLAMKKEGYDSLHIDIVQAAVKITGCWSSQGNTQDEARRSLRRIALTV